MADRSIDIIIQAQNKASKEIKGLQKELKGLSSTSKKVSEGMNDSAKGAKALSLGIKGIKFRAFTRGAIAVGKLSDSFYSMQNGLRQVSKSEEELNINQAKMLKMANDAKVPIDTMTQSYVRFDKVNTAIGGNSKETEIMISNLSKGLSLSGASAREAGSTMLQLSQAFGSGALMGDEFRAVSESMPMMLDILAKQLGVTRGEVKQMGSDGKITSQVLKDALLRSTNEINTAFSRNTTTIGQSLQVLKNNFLTTFGELDKKYGITQKIVLGITEITKKFEEGMPIVAKYFEGFKSNQGVQAIKMITDEFTKSSKETGIWGVVSSTVIKGVGDILKKVVTLRGMVLLGIYVTLTKVGEGIGWVLAQIVIQAQRLVYVFKTIGARVGNFVKGALIDFKNLLVEAKQWGMNLVTMIGDGIKSKMGEFKASVNGIATTISDYLGFHSPTKVGPASDSDKWMPNFIKMISGGLDQGQKRIATSVDGIASQFKNIYKKEDMETLKQNLISLADVGQSAFSEITGKMNDKKQSVTELKTKLTELKAKYLEIGTEGAKRLEEITKKINDQKLSISNLGVGFKSDVAGRIIEIKNQLDEINKKQQEGTVTVDDIKTKEKLRKELEVANTLVTQEDIKKRQAELDRSQTQVLLDNYLIEKQKATEKLAEIEAEYTLKKQKIEEEKARIRAQFEETRVLKNTAKNEYWDYVNQKIELEGQYFDFFKVRLQEQMTETKKFMTLFSEAKAMTRANATKISGARATGGQVNVGKSYLVGERGPELFTPPSNGRITANNKLGGGGINVSINMGGVQVNNQQDANYFANIIMDKITRNLQLNKLGIS